LCLVNIKVVCEWIQTIEVLYTYLEYGRQKLASDDIMKCPMKYRHPIRLEHA
jgi:hypothetical protein